MIRPQLALNQLPFAELLDDCLFILEKDETQLARQTALFKRVLKEAKKSPEEIDQWQARLDELQTRIEFYRELVGRVSSFDKISLLSSLSLAIEQAKLRGTPHDYGFTIYFTGGEKPLTLIH